MMARAIICCAALILGLLATLGATAQSVEKSRPLDLMSFMRGGAQSSGKSAAKTTAAKSSKHRHGSKRPAKRPDKARDVAALPSPAPLRSAAASVYASHAENDVQVVTSDQLNPIDLAMLRSSPETDGTAQKAETNVGLTSADAGQVHDQVRDQIQDQVQDQAGDAAPKVDNASATRTQPVSQDADALRDESWMGRLWSAVGDGFVALVAMIRQLFA